MPSTSPKGSVLGTMTANDAEDSDPIDELDRAIVYCLDTPDLDPRIRSAFIDAMLDRRNRATKEHPCP